MHKASLAVVSAWQLTIHVELLPAADLNFPTSARFCVRPLALVIISMRRGRLERQRHKHPQEEI